MTIFDDLRERIAYEQEGGKIEEAFNQGGLNEVVKLVMSIIDDGEAKAINDYNLIDGKFQSLKNQREKKHFEEMLALRKKAYDEHIININNIGVIACDDEVTMSYDEKQTVYEKRINEMGNIFIWGIEYYLKQTTLSESYIIEFYKEIEKELNQWKIDLDTKRAELGLEINIVQPIQGSSEKENNQTNPDILEIIHKYFPEYESDF